MANLQEVKEKVISHLPGSEVSVKDMTGGGDHLEITVVSDAFEGKNLIARHRMVYAALGAAMESEIHAARLVTKTKSELEG